MEKSVLKILKTLCPLILLAACTGQGTEVGNPTSTRIVQGKLQGGATPFLVKSLATAASCPTSSGDVEVVFVSAAGDTVSAPVSAAGSFSQSLDQTQRYAVELRQGTAVCGHLYYQSEPIYDKDSSYSPTTDGRYVVLGKGAEDIPMGDITDLGEGVFVAANNPSSYCDDDGNGVPDSEENDANHDGITDSDTNNDGYVDWYKESTENTNQSEPSKSENH